MSSYQVFKLSICHGLIVHLWETRFPFLDRPSLPLVGLLDSFSERKMGMLVREKKILKMGLMKMVKIMVLIDIMKRRRL